MKRGAGVIVIKDGKVVLVKAGPASRQILGTIALPGGQIDPGETDIEAARREFREETGLEARDLMDFPGSYIVGKVERKNGEILEVGFKVFLVTDFTGNLQKSDETEPYWVTIDEARATKLYGSSNKLLDNALEFLKLL